MKKVVVLAVLLILGVGSIWWASRLPHDTPSPLRTVEEMAHESSTGLPAPAPPAAPPPDSAPPTDESREGKEEAERGAVLRGRVVRSGTGEGLPGARIGVRRQFEPTRLNHFLSTTGARGGFEVAGVLTFLPVSVTVTADGFGSVERVFAPGEWESEVLIELGDGGTVSGTVRNAEGWPIRDTELIVTAPGVLDPFGGFEGMFVDESMKLQEHLRIRTRSDAEGRYRITGLATPMDYVIWARSKDDRRAFGEAFRLDDAGHAHTCDVVVREQGTVRVRLNLPDGTRLPRWGRARISMDGVYGRVPEAQAASWDRQEQCWEFRGVSPGGHLLVVDHDLYVEVRRAIVVTAGKPLLVEFDLEAGSFFTGRLVDSVGKPIQGHVHFIWTVDDLERTKHCTTESDGTFRLSGIPVVEGHLRVYAREYVEQSWSAIRSGKDVGEVILRRYPRVIGRLLGIKPGVMVLNGVVFADGRGNIGDGFVMGDGTFVFDMIPPGVRTHVYLKVSGRAPFVRRDIVLSPEEVLDLGEIHLPEPQSLSGEVREHDGKPVRFARVCVVDAWRGEPAVTDEAGKFRIENLSSGPCSLWVDVKGEMRAGLEVDVGRTPEPVVIEFLPQGKIECRVVDADGKPASGGLFRVRPIDANGEVGAGFGALTQHGGRLRLHVPEGIWTLVPAEGSGLRLVKPCPDITVTHGSVTRVTLVVE